MATNFAYLLNAMERAAGELNPAEHDYRAKRTAVLAHVDALEAERDQLRDELQNSQNRLKASGRAKLREEVSQLRAELAECIQAKNESLDALSDMVFEFFASASDDMDLLSLSFMSAEERAISVLIKYGRAKEESPNRYRLIDAALAAEGENNDGNA